MNGTDLTEAQAEARLEYIRRLVETAPPLTVEARARIAGILLAVDPDRDGDR